MREIWARRIVLLTALLVGLLAILFSYIQNPSSPTATTNRNTQAPATALTQNVVPTSPRIAAGWQIYQHQGCARCHAIAGEGNPRNPLDGVGEKHSAAELRDFILGADALQGVLPENIRKM